MRNIKFNHIIMYLCLLTGVCLCFGGCSLPALPKKSLVLTTTPSPTPEPVITTPPTDAPTPTPSPTPTPAPRQIGSASGSGGFIYMTNDAAQRLREIHLQLQDSGEWGRNLIPADSSIRGGERVRLFYPAAVEGYSPLYNMQVLTEDGSLYSIYSVNFTDMETASLKRDGDGALYLSYMSLSEHSEKNTRDTSWTEYSNGDSDDWDYYYDDYDDWSESGSHSSGSESSSSGSSSDSSSPDSGSSDSGSSDSGSSDDSIESELDFDESDEEWDYILEEE